MEVLAGRVCERVLFALVSNLTQEMDHAFNHVLSDPPETGLLTVRLNAGGGPDGGPRDGSGGIPGEEVR